MGFVPYYLCAVYYYLLDGMGNGASYIRVVTLELDSLLVHWYKDRDFPEIKSSNSDIVAVVENPKQLDRIIREHNKLVDYVMSLEPTSVKFIKELNGNRS